MSTDPPSRHEPYAELAAGYALHALEPDDEATFLPHLAECRTCQADIAASTAALAELAFALPGTPPVGLREAVLDSARTHAISGGVTSRPVRRAQRRPRRAAPWLLTAAASAVAVAAAASNVTMRHAARDTRAQLASTRAVLACASDAGCETQWLASADGSRHGAVLVQDMRARLVVDALPRNDRSHDIYVLWRRDGTGTLLAVRGFDIANSGVNTIDVGPIGPHTGFAVSREPGRTLPAHPTQPLLLPSGSA
jgi:hypothetical protein